MSPYRLARLYRFRWLSVWVGAIVAVVPCGSSLAQTNAAQQAVRQRLDGLGQTESVPPQGEPTTLEALPSDQTPVTAPAPGMIDTTYVTPGATVLVSLRPAQLLAAPMAQLLPVEVAKVAGLEYAGIDPETVDEIVFFADPSALPEIVYGATFKFNTPFRGSSIPPHARPAVQLSELAGRKYLQSSHPIFPSFYGTNRQTLILGPDPTLRQVIESANQPKTGPLVERVRDVPSSYDLYIAVDVARLRPLMQSGLNSAQLPDNIRPMMQVIELVSAIELTFNLSAPGPSSFVVHANDEAAAGQLESFFGQLSQQYQPDPDEEAITPDDPIQQAMARYRERMGQPFKPRRNGASITLIHIDGQDPAERQLTAIPILVVAAALAGPALEAAQQFTQAGLDVQADAAPVEVEQPSTAPPEGGSFP